MSAAIDVDVAVIGGGPAGCAAARAVAREGAAVLLVEAASIGGRAASATTIPMRVLTRAADRGARDWAAIREEIAERARAWSERVALTLDDAGVQLVRGRARFSGPNALAIDGSRAVTFARAVIAAGARAAALPGAAPDGARVLSPDQLAGLEALPRELMVIGGGPAGAEIADALSRLGARVTWVMDELGILPSFDRELAEAVGDVLMGRGVKLVHGKKVLELAAGAAGVSAKLDGGRTYAAPLAVVAVGSEPCTADLALEAAGISAGARLVVDDACRTSVPHVFAAGEVTGRTQDVAGAEAMGRAAGRAAAGVAGPPFVPARVPQVAYTRPEVAQVGLSVEAAAGREVALYTLRLEEALFGHLARIGAAPEDKGFVRLVCDSESDRVLGASALGPGAADAIGAAALALELGATAADLARACAAVPSALEALARSAR